MYVVKPRLPQVRGAAVPGRLGSLRASFRYIVCDGRAGTNVAIQTLPPRETRRQTEPMLALSFSHLSVVLRGLSRDCAQQSAILGGWSRRPFL